VLLVGAAEYGIEHLVERPQDFMRPLADALVPGFYLPACQHRGAGARGLGGRRDLRDVPGLWSATAAAPPPAARTAGADRGRPAHGGDIGVPDRTLLGRARGAYSWRACGAWPTSCSRTAAASRAATAA
jgi:hypothetical protein